MSTFTTKLFAPKTCLEFAMYAGFSVLLVESWDWFFRGYQFPLMILWEPGKWEFCCYSLRTAYTSLSSSFFNFRNKLRFHNFFRNRLGMTIILINVKVNSISNIAILIIWLGLKYHPGLGQFSSWRCRSWNYCLKIEVVQMMSVSSCFGTQLLIGSMFIHIAYRFR